MACWHPRQKAPCLCKTACHVFWEWSAVELLTTAPASESPIMSPQGYLALFNLETQSCALLDKQLAAIWLACQGIVVSGLFNCAAGMTTGVKTSSAPEPKVGGPNESSKQTAAARQHQASTTAAIATKGKPCSTAGKLPRTFLLPQSYP